MDRERRRRGIESLWRLAYPEQCVLCGRLLGLDARYLCGPCREGLPWMGEPACPRCGQRVAEHAAIRKGCAACWHRRFAFARAVAPFRYEGAIRELVLRFKLVREAWLAHLLGGLLCDHLARGGLSQTVDLVAPVPLHWRRRLGRGFNQAGLLTLEIGARFDLPVASGLLRRTRATTSQTAFSRLRREANVRGAFAVRAAAAGPNRLARLLDRVRRRVAVRGRAVLLVDDVLTTGSTVNECARTLRQAGARRVMVATVAKTAR